MNKTISVTLGGLIFNLEEEAYQKLNQYLNDIREHLGTSTDQTEVMSDIELSISEKFSQKISESKQVITLNNIKELIAVMGTIEDFDNDLKDGDAKPDNKEKTEEKSLKKLYRNPDDTIIAGVCSGLAVYFGIDPVIVRLFFALSIFFGGFGVILYIILWVIIPEAKSSSQKLEMSGDPVTLAAIEQVIKKNVDKIKEQKNNEKLKSSFRKLIELPIVLLKAMVTIIKKIAKAFLPMMAALFGFLFFLIGVLSIIALSVAFCIAIFNLQNPNLISDVYLSNLASQPLFKVLLIGLYFVIIIPVSFLLTLGISLLRRKSSISLLQFMGLIGLWMAALMVVATIGFQYAPQIESKVKEHETKTVIMKNFNLDNFSSISASNDLNIKVIKGENYTITASGNKDDLDGLKASVNQEQLELGREIKTGFCIFCLYNGPVQLTITMPDLKSYQAGDATRLTTEGFIRDAFTINLEDAAQATITADIKNINIKQSDASKFTLYGITATSSDVVMTVSLSDAANLYAYNFPVDTSEIKLRGASFAEITANKSIIASVFDASKLYYKGEAVINNGVIDDSVIDPAARIIKVNTTDRIIK